MITKDDLAKLIRLASLVGKLESRPAMSHPEVLARQDAQNHLANFLSDLHSDIDTDSFTKKVEVDRPQPPAIDHHDLQHYLDQAEEGIWDIAETSVRDVFQNLISFLRGGQTTTTETTDDPIREDSQQTNRRTKLI